jgi:tetratricopeptide (TPR) repeat protein
MTLEELDATAKQAYYSMDLPTALRCYAEAFVRYPKLALAYNNYGNILRETGYPEEAYGFLETAMKLDPTDRNFPFNYAVAHLAAGDLEKGWELFEARWRFKYHEHTLEGWTKPRWNGESIAGKRLLITCEEGDGDNIQFIRFVYQLNELEIEPIIQTEMQLEKLFKNSFPKFTVINNTQEFDDFDYWTPILSIPKCLRITYNNFPKIKQYLKPSKESVKKWNKILGNKDKKRIGFCWRGRSKNYPLEELIKLLAPSSEYEYVNLQINYNDTEKKLLESNNIKNYIDEINDWNDTAALINNLDLVISIDTGLIHLAGALNKKGILLLDKYKSCWRWLYESEETIWYDSVKLVRQKEQNNFSDQLLRVWEVQTHLLSK